MNHLKAYGIEEGEGKYYEEAIYGVGLLYNLINNKISSYLSQYNLSPAKFNVLMIVKHQGGREGISQVEISKRLIVTASNMTRLIDKLEQEKLIYRLAQEGDRRVNIVKVTERASKLLDIAWPGYVENLKRLTSEINGEEQKTLAGLIVKWVNTLIK